MRIVCFVLFFVSLFYSCSNETKKSNNLLEIHIDIDKNITLPLSEITENIAAIELELTDENLINPEDIIKILLSDSLIFISEPEHLFVFNIEGKFIRSIGSKGQGPGEYIRIKSFTFDEKNQIIYINSDGSQILGYDLTGKFLKKITIMKDVYGGQILGINYFNNELLLLIESIRVNENEKINCYHSVIYTADNEMQLIDSCFVRDMYFLKGIIRKGRLDDYLTCNKQGIYVYYPELSAFIINSTPSLSQISGNIERVLHDTLYRFENNQLVPELKLKFNRKGRDYDGNKNIQLYKIYRSSRYIFAEYITSLDKNLHFLFCYDTKTGIGYNSTKYRDEVNNIEKKVWDRPYYPLRPISNNTELFYYLHTHMEPDDLNEPNPTLYIGKLKK